MFGSPGGSYSVTMTAVIIVAGIPILQATTVFIEIKHTSLKRFGTLGRDRNSSSKKTQSIHHSYEFLLPMIKKKVFKKMVCVKDTVFSLPNVSNRYLVSPDFPAEIDLTLY